MSYAVESKKRKFHRVLESISKPAPTENTSKPSTSTSEPTKGNVPNRLLNNPSIKKVRLSGNEDSDLVSVRNSVLKLSSPGSRSSSASSKRPTFVPWDRDAFLERLETFRRVDRWTSKPTPINEVQWAKWGWVCTDVMRVSCISGCGGSVVVKLPDEIDELDGYDVEKVQGRKEVRTRLVEEYSKRLREGHGENCPWRNKSCDATIQHLPLSNMDSAVARLRERYRNIMKMGDKLPSEDAVQTPEEFDMDSLIKLLPDDWSKDAETSTGEAGQATQASANGEEPTSQPTTEPTAEPSKSIHKAALAMACFGWDSVADGAAGLVGCKACFRRLGLWMYKPKENGDVTVYTSLDVASEHMEYCPWINRSAQSGTGNANEKVDNLRSGWQIVVEGCKVKHRRQLRSVASMNTLHSRPSTPFEENIPDDETEESRKSADREWWAKIRRVRHALTPKSSRKSTASKQ